MKKCLLFCFLLWLAGCAAEANPVPLSTPVPTPVPDPIEVIADADKVSEPVVLPEKEEPASPVLEEDVMIDRSEERIYVQDNEFLVNGKRIWFNGTNTPWHKWNDFGGGYDDDWWDEHFTALHEAGVNSVRVWINCNNDQGALIIDENGLISGVSEKHWADLDLFFKTAERNQIYIMATLISFDHFKDSETRKDAEKWRNMITHTEGVESFVEQYTIPLVKRYGGNPYLWSIDLCNEPDWIYESKECGRLKWADISYFFARNAAAIHENSDVLVTVGMSFPKYNADGGGAYEGNKVSDAYLQKLYENKNAYLDFWSTHYYDWVGEWYGVPFYTQPYGAKPKGWGLDASKPALIGECPAKGTKDHTLLEDYENAYLNGYQGVMPWTSNAVDANGGFDDLAPATRYMAENYREIIFPLD